MRQSYIDFIYNFSGLNPFELAHLSEILLVKFEDILANGVQEKLPFSQQDIKHAVICAMRVLQMEMAENQMQEAKCMFCRTKQNTFTEHWQASTHEKCCATG